MQVNSYEGPARVIGGCEAAYSMLVVKQRRLCPKHRLGPWRDACPCSLHTLICNAWSRGLAEGQGGVASRPGSSSAFSH